MEGSPGRKAPYTQSRMMAEAAELASEVAELASEVAELASEAS